MERTAIFTVILMAIKSTSAATAVASFTTTSNQTVSFLGCYDSTGVSLTQGGLTSKAGIATSASCIDTCTAVGATYAYWGSSNSACQCTGYPRYDLNLVASSTFTSCPSGSIIGASIDTAYTLSSCYTSSPSASSANAIGFAPEECFSLCGSFPSKYAFLLSGGSSGYTCWCPNDLSTLQANFAVNTCDSKSLWVYQAPTSTSSSGNKNLVVNTNGGVGDDGSAMGSGIFSGHFPGDTPVQDQYLSQYKRDAGDPENREMDDEHDGTGEVAAAVGLEGAELGVSGIVGELLSNKKKRLEKE